MTEPEFRNVPIDQLRESSTNPRRRFDEASLGELVSSVRMHGVLAPLLVRPIGTNGDAVLEIVAGARRYRAAKLAGLEELPVRVREMTDEQALELQVTENLQRADLHPLDEALGYRALIEKAKYDVESIAAKVGKSSSYVYQRLKLADLTEYAQRLFLEDKITAGHAILIARLPEEQQKRLLKDKLFRPDYSAEQDKKGKWPERPLTVRELGATIHVEFHLDLKESPWPKDDGALVEAAGPCVTCPKRTGFSPALFPDIEKADTCTDPACFAAKGVAWVARRKAELGAAGQPVVEISTSYGKTQKGTLPQGSWVEIPKNAGNCIEAAVGIVVEGQGVGRELRVCAGVTRCKVHKVSRAAPPRPPSSESAADPTVEVKEKFKLERRARIFREIFARRAKTQKAGFISGRDLEVIAGYMLQAAQGDDHIAAVLGCKETEVQKRIANASAKDLAVYVVAAAIVEDVERTWPAKTDDLLDAAKRYGVDLKKIDQAIDKEQAEAIAAVKAAAKKKAEKKSPPKKAPVGRRVETSATAEASA